MALQSSKGHSLLMCLCVQWGESDIGFPSQEVDGGAAVDSTVILLACKASLCQLSPL